MRTMDSSAVQWDSWVWIKGCHPHLDRTQKALDHLAQPSFLASVHYSFLLPHGDTWKRGQGTFRKLFPFLPISFLPSLFTHV